MDHLQRTVLNAILLDRDPRDVRCGPTCNGRSTQTRDGHLRPGESLAPRVCPHVALALVWLHHQRLITVDERGVRPTRLARPPRVA